MLKNQLYLDTGVRHTLTTSMHSVFTLFLAGLVPSIGEQLGYKLLATPLKKKSVFKRRKLSAFYEAFFDFGTIRVFYFHGGGSVILCHGWGDDLKSFQSIINRLLQENYNPWSFDLIAEKSFHATGFIAGIVAIFDYNENMEIKVHGIISRSKGYLVVLNQRMPRLEAKCIIFFATTHSINDKLEISEKFFITLIEDMDIKYKLDPLYQFRKLEENFLLIHYKNDQHYPFKKVEIIVDKSPAQLYATEHLPHRDSPRESSSNKFIFSLKKNKGGRV